MNSPSRILSVATAIEKTQVRRTTIAKEITTLEVRLTKLEDEENLLAAKQVDLARQMDKLTVGSFVSA